MNAKLLLASLKLQEVNLNHLIESLEMQRQAILKNDYTALEEAITKEQIILKDLDREEMNRSRIVKEISDSLKLNLQDFSLAALIKKGNQHFPGEIKELAAFRKNLREKVTYIQNMNTQLKDVIVFSRNLIKETMMAIAGLSKRTLVNKRV